MLVLTSMVRMVEDQETARGEQTIQDTAIYCAPSKQCDISALFGAQHSQRAQILRGTNYFNADAL